jgi:hypothetical protein
VQEGKPPAPDRTCKAAEAITTRAAGLRSRTLGGPPGWSAQAARLPGAQSRNSNWARYRKEISDNIKNSRLAVVLGFGPALRWGRPDSFQEPGPRFRRDVGFVSDALPDRIGFAVAADTLFGLIFFRCAVARTCLADRGGPGRDRRRVLDLICLDWP